MSPFNQNPEQIAQVFSRYIKTLVQILVWTTVGLASVAATYIAVTSIWMGVRYILRAIF